MKDRVLTEKVLAEEEVLTELVVYFPENGAVVRQHKDAKDKGPQERNSSQVGLRG